MNILFVTHAPPDVPRDGARLITHHLARELSAEHCLHLVSLYDEAEASHPQLKEWFAARQLVPLPKRPRFQKWAASFMDDVPLAVRAYNVPGLHDALSKMLNENPINVVHCDTGLMAQYVKGIENLPRIVAPHDALTRAFEQQAQYAPNLPERFAAQLQIEKMRRYEAEKYARFQRVVVVSTSEREYLQTLAPKLKVCVIPNGVNTDDFAPSSEPETPNSLGFLGVMDVVPNQAAAIYFAREIFPRIQREIPDATLTIIGRNPTPQIRALGDSHIHVMGTVDDVRPHIAAQSIMICPMRAAGGIKNKLLEALAMGKAIVATPEAVDGLDIRNGEQVVLANSAETFAEECVRLLRDSAERTRLGQHARAWALQHTWQKTAQMYVELYRTMIDDTEHRATLG